SVLPVWLLLQPRDYINALQLITALALLVLGLVATGVLGGPTIPVETATGEVIDHTLKLEWVAPALDWSPQGAPPLLPVLFITVACGACSGFHCLVGSGTTSKQLERETDAKPVGYGSMLTEGFLATLVIAACAAGIGLGQDFTARPDVDVNKYEAIEPWSEPWRAEGESFVSKRTYMLINPPIHYEHFLLAFIANQAAGPKAFELQYASWQSSNSLGAKVGAFVQGSANMLARLGIPIEAAIALMAVLVASFAATTLDTSCRLQRYVIQELARTFLPKREHHECHACGYDRAGIPTEALCPECNADAPTPGEMRTTNRGPWWNPFRWIATPIGATTIAIVSAFALAMGPYPKPFTYLSTMGVANPIGTPYYPPMDLAERFGLWIEDGGTGALTLWPLFGATNQLLAGFAFIVIVSWLRVKRKPWAFAIAPAVLMLLVPASAMAWQAFVGNEANPSWLSEGRTTLVVVACATLLMEAWLIIEASASWKSKRFKDALDDSGGQHVV
ncbi:MAG: carbon starvation CstA family protein, partial [Planctomycetota bacterium]